MIISRFEHVVPNRVRKQEKDIFVWCEKVLFAYKKANVDDSEWLELIQMCQDIVTILLIVPMNYARLQKLCLC